ncbi:MAG: OsmC family protein [Halobacteria archaeon]|nr:OsmC family protein [Halobacteria archaeon]
MNRVNGLPTQKLESLLEDVNQNPEAASFTFRSETEWTGGFSSVTRISDFDHNGETVESPEFEIVGDEPEALLGEREGPNAVELLLGAVGSCLSVTYAGHAAAKGIEIEDMEFEFEGELDLRGFLGIGDVRPGYDEISCRLSIETEASEEEIESLHEEVKQTSPLYDNVTNEVSLDISLETN